MKLGIVHQPFDCISIPAREGSLEIWMYEVARRVAKSCDIVVYCRKWKHLSKAQTDEGVVYWPVSTGKDDFLGNIIIEHPGIKRLPGLRNPKRPLFASGFANIEYGFRAARALRKQRPDVIHIMNYSDLVPPIRALNPKAKIILHMQCEWLNQLDHRMIRNRLTKVDLVIGCSDYISGRIRSAFRQFSDRIETVYNGADTRLFSPFPDDVSAPAKRLVYVGRLAPEKGPHVLLEAFKKIAERQPDTQLEMAGPRVMPPREFTLNLEYDAKVSEWGPYYRGNYLAHLNNMLRPEIAAKVTFSGLLSRSELAKHFRSAAIAVFPSIWNEPFGMVIAEAMSAGLPVVATRGGGIPEIVEHGNSGLLVERGDVSALADAILYLLEHEDVRRCMGQAARKRVLQLFGWDKIAQDTLRQYGGLCSPVKVAA